MPAGDTGPPEQPNPKTPDAPAYTHAHTHTHTPAHAHAQLGRPRIHLRRTDSTNERARQLAVAGAPHGTLVTADEQTAGRGRQGRSWLASPRSALLCSLVLRDPPPLLSLLAGVAVCDAIDVRQATGHAQAPERRSDPHGEARHDRRHAQASHGEPARLKWPNDVVIERAVEDGASTLAKLAGILVEGRPQESWAVLGIGVNVALNVEELPADVRAGAASLQRYGGVEPLLADLLRALAQRLAEPAEETLASWRARDALPGRGVSWANGAGLAEGIDNDGHLLVRLKDGTITALGAGEVHLEPLG